MPQNTWVCVFLPLSGDAVTQRDTSASFLVLGFPQHVPDGHVTIVMGDEALDWVQRGQRTLDSWLGRLQAGTEPWGDGEEWILGEAFGRGYLGRDDSAAEKSSLALRWVPS